LEDIVKKLIAITLTALFLTTTALPAEAAKKPKKDKDVEISLLSTIPGLNGCCIA